MTTVALYARVSTERQDAANQLPEIERLCRARGWTITHRYEEAVSGAAKLSPELARMLADAHAGRFQAVVCWAIDRLGRGGIAEVAGIIATLDAANVALVSVREPWADTSGPVRDLLVSVMAWVAQQERHRLRERVLAGLATARRKGIRLGRPRVADHVLERGLRLVAEGSSIAKAARAVGISASRLRQARAARRAEVRP
jgi:DNA invertase Pin-like site-specific DNA recombinase